MNLVVHQMRELQHVDVTDGDLLSERFAGHAVEERKLAGFGQARDLEQVADLGFTRAVKNGRGHGDAIAEGVGEFE